MSQTSDIKGALTLVGQILQRRKLAGFDTVPLSKEGLATLQDLPMAFLRRGSSPVANHPAPTPAPEPKPVSVAKTPPPANTVAAVTEAKSPPQKPQTEKPGPAPTPPLSRVLENSYGDLAVKTEMRGRAEIIYPAGDTVREKLNNLFRMAKKCEVCRGMGTLRDQLVFASGNPESDLVFVGEAPGEEDENQRKPLVGPAGQKLDQILQAMGLKREDVYVSNILKYRPKIGDGRFQGPKNRKPTPEEIAVSIKYVRSEIEVIRPRVIVALGATVAEGLLEESGSMSSLRERFFDLDGIPVSVTYHPSYLLRVESETDQELARQEKRKVWEDALGVMEKLGMPISDKQRGFFSK